MRSLKQYINEHRYTCVLFGVLVLAAVLRLYHLTQIPLANDELSALYRLQFPSFKTLITQGVMPDGHPALVQVFLYYYSKLVGSSSSLLKLPFIICGVASVWVAYTLFTLQLGRRVGLMVALSMTTTQFFIMHSQLARPYSVGLLFILLLALYLHKLASKPSRLHYLGAVLFMFLSASTHYIALLTAVCLMFAWVWVDVKRLSNAIRISALVTLLYVPQLVVFFQQLKVGGVGSWLGKPQLNFIYHFFSYSQHHFGPLMMLTFVLGWASLLFLGIDKFTKKQLYPLVVFGLTFLVAFIYSVYRNPVLQFPVLLFAWPFMLAFLFSAVRYLPKTLFIWVIGLMTCLQLYSLVYMRKHYQVFYNQSYRATVKQIVTNVTPHTPLLLNGNQPFYFNYYFAQSNFTPNYLHTRIDSLSIPLYQKLLQNTQADTLVVAHAFYLSSLYFEWAKVYYPTVIFHQQQAFNELYVLCKNQELTQHNKLFDTLTSATLYSKNSRLTCDQLPQQRLRVVAKVEFTNDTLPNNSVLVVKVFDMSQRMIAESSQAYFRNTKQIALASLDIEPTPYSRILNVQAFVHNEKQQQLIIQNLTLDVQPGNSLIYGTIGAIPFKQ